MSFYQKYRPADFNSLYGQEFVREVLQNALKLDRTVGAYLFHGSRGTGKTTVARIMAKGMNCLSLQESGNPCGQCENCIAFEEGRLLDIIEIDAASNTGVDNIRDMIERAQFQPTQAPYKVYIIDEVHMLSKGAFNALLKTLEEPPKHVKFILATTEIHKIPDTIISRTQRYDFKRIKSGDIVDRLKFIAREEHIEAEESALSLIAHLAKWGLRDAITLFEQYAIGGVLKRLYIEENLEIIGDEFLAAFSHALMLKDIPTTLTELDTLRTKSVDVRLFLEQFLAFLRDQMVKHLWKPQFFDYSDLFDGFEVAYGKLKFVPDPFILLETTTFRLLSTREVSAATRAPVASAPSIQKTKEATPKVPLQNISEPSETTQKWSEVSAKWSATPTSGVGRVSEWIVAGATVIDETGSPMQKMGFSEVSQKPFSFTKLIEHIRTIPKRSFVGLSLKAASYDFSDRTLSVFPDNDFNFKKLDATDVRVLIVESMDELFGTGYSLEIGRWSGGKKAAKNLAEEAGDIF